MNILEKNNFDSVTMDGKELTVTSKVSLWEMFQRPPDKTWIKGSKKSLAFQLANDMWIFKIPAKEGGEYVWIKAKLVEKGSVLASFYKGGDSPDTYGPAKAFAKNNQTREIDYNLYDKNWKVIDIGTFFIEGEAEELLKDGDRIYFVTSKNGNERLFYLDSRKGEANGCGGVFIGEVFNPDVDIQSVL